MKPYRPAGPQAAGEPTCLKGRTVTALRADRRRRIWGVIGLAAALVLTACTSRDSGLTVTETLGSVSTSPAASGDLPPAASIDAVPSHPATGTPMSAAATGTLPRSAAPVRTARPSTASATSAGKHPPQPPARNKPPGPVPLIVTASDRQRAAQLVAAMSTAQQAGSVIMPVDSQADGKIAENHYGGVILQGEQGVVDGTKVGDPSQVKRVVAGLQDQRNGTIPMLIGVDQEYGEVTRLVNGFTDFPGASTLAAGSNTGTAVALTEQVAAAASQEMLAVGITVDFAPDADVLPSTGESAIGSRSYGTDPQRVAKFVAAAVRGYQSGGVAATIKHFPGLGRIAADTHNQLPSLKAGCGDWSSTEAVPMAAGVQAGAALAMTGHVLFPAVGADTLPASLSHTVVTELLRGKGSGGCRGLAFDGVTITDSMQMEPVANNYDPGEAAWRGLAAGEDLLLMPIDPTAAELGIVAATKTGQLNPKRLADAAAAVMALRIALIRSQHPSLDVIDSAAHRALDLRARAG